MIKALPALLGLLGLTLSCSSSGPTNPFAGGWNCSTSQSIAAAAATMGVAAVSINAASADQITMLSQIAGNPSCSLRFGSSGTTATLLNGQSCAMTSGGMAAYTMGTANVAGNALTASLSFELNGQDNAGAPLTGSGTVGYICDRLVAASGGGGW